MSTEEFESAMSENRPQVLICSVEFLTSKKVGLGAFPIVNGHLSLRVSGQRCDLKAKKWVYIWSLFQSTQMFSGQCKLLQISDGVVNIVSQTFRFQGAC